MTDHTRYVENRNKEYWRETIDLRLYSRPEWSRTIAAVTESMVEAGAIGMVQDVADHDGGQAFHEMPERARDEARKVSRACLTAALSAQPPAAQPTLERRAVDIARRGIEQLVVRILTGEASKREEHLLRRLQEIDADIAAALAAQPPAAPIETDTPLQAVMQQAIMAHPHFEGSATLAFGLAGAALKALSRSSAGRATAWLIEWPEDDTNPVRWWNPAHGWMRDANKAMWFVRKTDAECFLLTMRFGLNLKVTEHVFIGEPQTLPVTEVANQVDILNCDCGFSAEVCATNRCLRKKTHLAGMTPGSQWPDTGTPTIQITGDGTGNGRTTKPELTGSPSGTPQRVGDFIPPDERWVVGKNGWDASDEETREDV